MLDLLAIIAEVLWKRGQFEAIFAILAILGCGALALTGASVWYQVGLCALLLTVWFILRIPGRRRRSRDRRLKHRGRPVASNH
jgi:membrane protein implicated in regulation of membrane protease activity